MRENHPTPEKVTRGGEGEKFFPRCARSTILEEKWGTTCSLASLDHTKEDNQMTGLVTLTAPCKDIGIKCSVV